MPFQYFLACKNKHCSQPISLPLPTPSDKTANRVPWCMDGQPRNFVCLRCSHVYEYTVQDVQREFDERPNLMGSAIDSIFVLEATCGNRNCAAPIYILQTGHRSQQGAFHRSDWLQEPDFGTFRCALGHSVQTASVSLRMTRLAEWTWVPKY